MIIEEQVVLVDLQGRALGLQEKMQAHRDGSLHLAFSVLLYRETTQGIEFLMQQRALGKYHSGGLWTNTCCSHPRQGETLEQAGLRRLTEEMGIVGLESLDDIASFDYQALLDKQSSQYHVLIANGAELVIIPNPEEVAFYRWWSKADLELRVVDTPELFTAWCPQVLLNAMNALSSQ